ncbi:MAG TPA: hypothetical protein VNY84_05820, partial [Acidimicrobiales bacterium]|nr:hypothetical protein [Acidimicrobiales bacterium]
ASGVDGFGRIPRDPLWTFSLCLLAELCASVDQLHDLASILYRLLNRRAGQLAVAALAAAPNGAVDRFLGMLAAVDGSPGRAERAERAERHFRAAIAFEERIGALPAVARTQLWFARSLVARGGRGDRSEALRQIERALPVAEALGMARLSGELRAVGSTA